MEKQGVNGWAMVLLSVFLVGCSSAKTASNFESEIQNIKSLGVLPFHVNLTREEIGASKIDSAGEVLASKNLKESLLGWNARPISFMDVAFSGPSERREYDSTCFAILHGIKLWKTLEDVSVDSAFVAKYVGEKTEYAAILVLSGYSRTGARMAYEFTKTILVGVVTLGMVVPFNMSSSTQLEFVVLNAKSLKVIYYDFVGGESNPNEKKSIAKYFHKAVKNFRARP